MGVKGLAAALKRLGVPDVEVLPVGATLIIDGDGWAFEVLSKCDDNDALFGGNYVHLAAVVKSEVDHLQALGLKLVFYSGGGSDAFKDTTILKRIFQREEMWMNVYSCCRDSAARSGLDLPIPTMAMEQVWHSLAALDVGIVECEEEADQIIAKEVYNLNVKAGVENHFCYGRDSDFMVMKDCPYIEFGSIQKCEGGEGIASAVVYRRADTARRFDVSERLLIEMCIMSGNDFTSEYVNKIPSEFIEAPPVELENRKSAIAMLMDNCEWIREPARLDFFLRAASSTEIDIALRYSRAFYELEELAPYVAELELYRQQNNYVVPDGSMSVNLSRKEKNSLASWIEAAAGSVENASVGASVLSYVASKPLGVKGRTVSLNGSEVVLSDDHVNALSKMLEITSVAASYEGNQVRVSAKALTVPSWGDLMAAHAYQMLALKIAIERKEIDGFHFSEQPLHYFDGTLFHTLLARHRKLAEAKLSSETAGASLMSLTDKLSAMSIAKEEKQRDQASVPKPDFLDRSAPQALLPIDAFREDILHRVHKDRVTIIHGETGCGKSSRVPAMLLEESKRRGERCRMMISQPRRIAASSLMKRLRTTLGDEVGMRMGHGVRDESANTKLYFVTTGYLVRLLAYHPESFANHSHLIIDEVHERSIDGDVLCYLAKRLLSVNPTIKLILMSATMHIALYQEYFASNPSDSIYYGDLDCLSVGARRFPLQIFHADDLHLEASGLPRVFQPLYKKIAEKNKPVVDADFSKKQHTLAFNLILEVVKLGTGVLVFVSGIADITEINELFVGLNDSKYIIVHIHSDIPYEDQERAFEPVGPDQIKVVIATNAAESSITLPDVDVVICLGTHKAIAYDPIGHHVMLQNQFISKASAAQRAGRTGRTRPGTVYRLYSSTLYSQMSDHDTPEILRTPLEEVILNLRAMLEDSKDFEGVVPILESLLEPPETKNIESSFQQLHKYRMITDPGDHGELTRLGNLSGNLPVDLHLSTMIAYGIALGIGAEAVAMAAALTIPKSPFRTAHNLIHTDPDEFNEIIQKTYLSSVRADAGMYSYPLMLVRLLMAWRELKNSDYAQRERRINHWLRDNNIVRARIQQLDNTAKSMARTVSAVLQRVDRRMEARRAPKYDLSSWLAAQDPLESDSDSSSESGISEASSFPCLPYDDGSIDEDDNELAHERDVPTDLDEPSLEVNLTNATEEDIERAAQKLNMCRLILAWSSDELVLRMILKVMPTPEKASVLRLGNTNLSNEQLKSLFPPDVPFEFQSSGDKLVYTGEVRGALNDILSNLCTVGQFMADSRYDTNDSRWRRTASIDRSPPCAWIMLKREDELTLFYAASDEEMENNLYHIFPEDKVEDTGMDLGIYRIFGVRGVSKSELKAMTALRNTTTRDRMLSMTIPDMNPASLTVTGGKLRYEDLETIFSTSGTNNDHGNKNEPPGVKIQITGGENVLSFAHENDCAGSPYSFKDSLIKDIPVGMRLYSSYRNSRFRDKFVLVRQSPQQNAVGGHRGAAATPGSAQWHSSKTNHSGGKKDTGNPNEDHCIITASPISSAWESKRVKVVGGLALKSIFLPVASPISTAIHTGPEPVFGCAFSALDISPGNKQKCDGISIFPVGYKWITLAYECMNYSVLPIYDGSSRNPPMKEEKVTSKDRKLIRLIQQLVTEQVELRPVSLNSNLVDAVNLLFSQWVKGREAVVEEIIEASNSDERESDDDFDQTVDYMAALYKRVRDQFSEKAAESIAYKCRRAEGDEFVATVTFCDGENSYSSEGSARKKALAKRMAAFICWKQVFPTSAPSPKKHATAAPPLAQGRDGLLEYDRSADNSGELQRTIRRIYGSAAAKYCQYSTKKDILTGITAGTLTIRQRKNGPPFVINIEGEMSNKEAKSRLAFEGIRELTAVKNERVIKWIKANSV